MENRSYVGDETWNADTLPVGGLAGNQPHHHHNHHHKHHTTVDLKAPQTTTASDEKPPLREKWGRNIEFLLSCVALSVGFGNVWRFPYTAFKNGGGAFVIPYLIVLFIIGRPIYYLEMVLGQFSNRGCVKVYDLAPAMRGIGVGQTVAIFTVITYYASVLAVTLRYLVASFNPELPWAKCDPTWPDCVDSSRLGSIALGPNVTQPKTSADLYFRKTVMHAADSLDDGLGYPDWRLALCLVASWICIVGILIKGIKSSGKVSYFLAIFPYIIIAVLLVRSLTLEGAWTGIKYFFEPQWDKLLTIEVWYEAVTQCFFSLTICFGGLIVYSSFNDFSNNIYRHALIITSLDTVTSLVAGCVVFGVIGHLAHVTGQSDISKVVQSGPALTFITYPDTIAKFDFLPQFFSVLFFFMLFLLGIGTLIGIVTSVITAIHDQRPDIARWKIVISVGLAGFCIGLVYITPGGLIILELLDYYGATLVTITLAVFELLTFAWIYGVNRVCKDIEFMLGIKTGLFWRVCWGIVTPITVLFILLVSLIQYKPQNVPLGYNALGWCLYAFAVLQLPCWAVYAILQKQGLVWWDRCKAVLRPMADWGPEDPTKRSEYGTFIEEYKQQSVTNRTGNLVEKHTNCITIGIASPTTPVREKWTSNIEFTLSCIAYSVGFGNIWKFPYTALDNGGGAFLIPYLVVLFLIGRPLYYLEMAMGQFCSRGCVKIYDMAPAMRGVGVGQSVAMVVAMSYYTPILAITLRYLLLSFSSELPWSKCDHSWSRCINSDFRGYANVTNGLTEDRRNVSAELYFTNTIMHRAPLAEGLGWPDGKLVLCLLVSWSILVVILIKGVRSTGKAAYFLAIFPYVIIFILLAHSLSLEGSLEGIKFFLTPKWESLFSAKVWMEAVTQCFFSLSICFGGIIAYSSFNNFSNNVYRDAMIISWLDTFTSIVVGCIVFGVLGNLAHVTHRTSIQDIVREGPGLTFMAYPDAIAKFEYCPQLFSVLFFLMFFIVGIGSNLGAITSVITAIRDRCPTVENWKIVMGVSVSMFCISVVYLAPGGLDLLDVLDTYGAKYVTLTLALFEILTFAWIYGVDRVCRDIKFMLQIETGLFWRICWGIIAPLLVGVILIVSFVDYVPLNVPAEYNVAGWILYTFAILQLPLWAGYAIMTQDEKGCRTAWKTAFQPSTTWGPENELTRDQYNKMESKRSHFTATPARHCTQRLCGKIFD
uniref:Transporter n=1 Tax=Anopheles coluzzii TaxID=1518534 RepID=A0A8W7P9P5_ANOCL